MSPVGTRTVRHHHVVEATTPRGENMDVYRPKSNEGMNHMRGLSKGTTNYVENNKKYWGLARA